ncbi:hypothetical protein J6590_087043 [Homalodisca vitripennis]|nr:hypothetical protein J6590_087043 [Homalodisca vitripennis]
MPRRSGVPTRRSLDLSSHQRPESWMHRGQGRDGGGRVPSVCVRTGVPTRRSLDLRLYRDLTPGCTAAKGEMGKVGSPRCAYSQEDDDDANHSSRSATTLVSTIGDVLAETVLTIMLRRRPFLRSSTLSFAHAARHDVILRKVPALDTPALGVDSFSLRKKEKHGFSSVTNMHFVIQFSIVSVRWPASSNYSHRGNGSLSRAASYADSVTLYRTTRVVDKVLSVRSSEKLSVSQNTLLSRHRSYLAKRTSEGQRGMARADPNVLFYLESG